MSSADPILSLASLADVANAGTPGAGVDFFTTPKTVPKRCFAVRVTIALGTAGILSYKKNAQGAIKLNAAGAALTVDVAHELRLAVRPGDTLNFVESGGGLVKEFDVVALDR